MTNNKREKKREKQKEKQTPLIRQATRVTQSWQSVCV